MTVITREIAAKVRDVIDAGLVSGVGKPIPGQMCVEAAVCYALDLPHGDDPGCVSAALRALKIRLNDSRWSSPQARARGLRRLGVAQLGSMGALDDEAFITRVVEMTIRTVVAEALRHAATRAPADAERLTAAAERCEREGSREAVREGRAAAADVSDLTDIAYAAAFYAAEAAYASADDDDAAACAVSAAAAAAAAVYAKRDQILSAYAERVVQILIDMGAPGCQWLDLVPAEAQS